MSGSTCSSNSPTSYFTYDETGQILTAKDPNGNITNYSFTDSFVSGDTYTSSVTPTGNTNTFLTKITYPPTNGISHIEKFSYDYPSGQLTVAADQNQQSTYYRYDDYFARLTQTTHPDNGQTVITYNDVPPTPSVTTAVKINSSLTETAVSVMDGVGHTIQSHLTSDPDGATYTVATYDGLGRTASTYNPTRCATPTTNCGESTWGITTNSYDPLSRITLVTEPDGSTQQTSYNPPCTTATDEAGKSRKSCSDGLGRMTQVFEDPASSNFETDYTYDALNNLLTVNQKGGSTNSANWRTRTFTYDSLSRLTQAVNPESGTIAYIYDSDGNLLHKTSPAPNQTGSTTVTLSYCYDALNRITGKAYTSQTCSGGLLRTPLVSYFYDQSSYNGLAVVNGIGHRTGMNDQAGFEAWSYDVVGHAIIDKRTTNSLSKTITYGYNLDGSTSSISLPTFADGSHPLLAAYQMAGAGRPVSMQDNGTTLVGAAHYTASGGLCYIQGYWNGTFTSSGTFNSRQQPLTFGAVQQFSGTPPPQCGAVATNISGATNMLNLSYNFVDTSGITTGMWHPSPIT